jgi:hypothetical protein
MNHTISIVVADQPGELSRIVSCSVRAVSTLRPFPSGQRLTLLGARHYCRRVLIAYRADRQKVQRLARAGSAGRNRGHIEREWR